MLLQVRLEEAAADGRSNLTIAVSAALAQRLAGLALDCGDTTVVAAAIRWAVAYSCGSVHAFGLEGEVRHLTAVPSSASGAGSVTALAVVANDLFAFVTHSSGAELQRVALNSSSDVRHITHQPIRRDHMI